MSAGDVVNKGHRLLVLEAMKMENDIPHRVKDHKVVHVQPGAVIESGKPLVAIESESNENDHAKDKSKASSSMPDKHQQWEEDVLNPALKRWPEREADFMTASEVPRRAHLHAG